jgi:uncharacterized protein YegP (UPF0339 family)
MATATKKVGATRGVPHGAPDVSGSASLEFLVYRDNGGDFHWEIVGERGEALARCGGFDTYDDAERAAWRVHDSAGSARFEPRVADDRTLGTV